MRLLFASGGDVYKPTPDSDTFEWKVSRCTSHFYRDALQKYALPFGRK